MHESTTQSPPSAAMVTEQLPAPTAAVRPPKLGGWFSVANKKGLTPLAVVILMIAVFYAINPDAVTVDTLSTLLDQSGILLLLALAQGIIVLMGRIDLSNAAVASFLSVVLVVLMNGVGGIAIPLVLILGMLLGALQGWVHTFFQIPSFVVTLGTSGIVAGAGLIVSGASAVSVYEGLDLVQWAYAAPGGIPLAFVLGAVIAVVLAFLVARTARGRSLRAVGFNQRAATYSGIRTTVTVVLGFACAGLLIGIASVLIVGQLGTASAGIANSYLLSGIAAVVVGGTAIAGGIGGPGRIVFGALIIALLRIGLDIVGVAPEYQPIIYGVIVVGAIAMTVDRSRTVPVA
jgi:ribose transport system permease protein